MNNKYEIHGDITIFFCRHRGERLEVLIDTEDLPLVDSVENTWVTTNGYIHHVKTVNWVAERTYLHRLIMGAESGFDVDHIDGNKLDNRKQNLRVCLHAENQQNKIKLESRNTSGYRGVSRESDSNLWRARIKLNGVEIRFGRFNTPEEAHEAVVKARAQYMPFSADARLAA